MVMSFFSMLNTLEKLAYSYLAFLVIKYIFFDNYRKPHHKNNFWDYM